VCPRAIKDGVAYKKVRNDLTGNRNPGVPPCSVITTKINAEHILTKASSLNCCSFRISDRFL